jgi:hypothetical protein
MAEKRAFVSAVLMATGASDIFTQDIEDFPELVGVPVLQGLPAPKEQEAEMPSPVSSVPVQAQATRGPSEGSSLCPKQSAWLMRVWGGSESAH